MKRIPSYSIALLSLLCLALAAGCASTLKVPQHARPLSSAQGKQVLHQIKDIMGQASGGSRMKIDKYGIQDLDELTTNRRSARQAGVKNAKKVSWSRVSKVRVVKDDFLIPSGSASWWVQVEGYKLGAWVRLGYFTSREQAQELGGLILRLHDIAAGKARR